MKNLLIFFLTFFFTNLTFAADEKPGRFFEDQPDVNDDYQIHFNYLLAQDSKDRELDINGKMEKIILMINKWMEISTSKNKKGDKVPRKYKLDYRSDGKLDITFIRMDKNFKDIHKWANNDITPFLYKKKGQTNNKKIYFDIYVQSLALLFDSKSIRSVHFCGAYSMPGFEHLFPFRT